VIAIIYYRNRL